MKRILLIENNGQDFKKTKELIKESLPGKFKVVNDEVFPSKEQTAAGQTREEQIARIKTYIEGKQNDYDVLMMDLMLWIGEDLIGIEILKKLDVSHRLCVIAYTEYPGSELDAIRTLNSEDESQLCKQPVIVNKPVLDELEAATVAYSGNRVTYREKFIDQMEKAYARFFGEDKDSSNG
jgi:hypothetical protein